MRVYIAGPMRGYPRWNFDAFDAAERRWKAAGHESITPANIDRALGVDPNADTFDDELLRRTMKIDVEIICSCDAIALLPGWEASAGVTVELALALYLGLKVYNALTMGIPIPIRLPWERIRCS